MRKPPIIGLKGKQDGFFKELKAASERAKAEVGDLQVYMRENQNSLINTPKHALMDWINKVSDQ